MFLKLQFHGKDFSNTPWPIVTLIIHNVSFCEYYKNAHWLYTIKNFKLSAVRLQPSMDKMDKDDNYLYTKNGETNEMNI